eukprot:gene112-biopygen33
MAAKGREEERWRSAACWRNVKSPPPRRARPEMAKRVPTRRSGYRDMKTVFNSYFSISDKAKLFAVRRCVPPPPPAPLLVWRLLPASLPFQRSTGVHLMAFLDDPKLLRPVAAFLDVRAAATVHATRAGRPLAGLAIAGCDAADAAGFEGLEEHVAFLGATGVVACRALKLGRLDAVGPADFDRAAGLDV